MGNEQTPEGELSKIGEQYDGLSAALDKNMRLKDFFAQNPDFYVTTGYADPIYSWNPQTGIVEAAAGPGSTTAARGPQIDTETFLAKLAVSLFGQTREMACQIVVRPNTVEGTVSVGVVSFSANWDIGELCKE